MAYSNQNFYNRNFTFHNIPPPPLPPRFFIPTPQINDQEFVKQFERNDTKIPKKMPSIANMKERMRALVLTLKALKEKEKMLAENVETLNETEWETHMNEIKKNKSKINEIMLLLNDSCLEGVRKALARRSAKRLRLKRLNVERQKEREEMIRARKERSRKIDENLQKIKDDIDRIKQEEEAKLQADSILREVLRKKHNAKKCIVKLEALMRLRHARQNTAKGRGESVSERDAVEFNSNVEKLISLWKRKLTDYDSEELELRDKLKASQPTAVSKSEQDINQTLLAWKQFLFAGEPQVDFKGDVKGFLAVRAQWDQYISKDGASLPIGWVVP